jgi:origin recognition complex subunit 1
MPEGCSIYTGASPHHRTLYIYSPFVQRTNGRRTVEVIQPSRRVARTDDVKDVIRNLQNSPTTAFLRSLSLHERILLAALLKCVRRTGVCEIPWADVGHQHHLYSGVFADSAPLPRELEGVLDALLAARGVRRVVLNLEQA